MLFKTKKRIIEEYEDRILQAVCECKEREDARNQKALELQQAIYDKKIKDLEEAIKLAYYKGRNEVLNIVKSKIKSGEIVRGKPNNMI